MLQGLAFSGRSDVLTQVLDRLRRLLGRRTSTTPERDGVSPANARAAPVFTADFGSTRQWVAGRSWAYPNGGPTNPGDNKLDYLVADPSYSRTGTFGPSAARTASGTRAC